MSETRPEVPLDLSMFDDPKPEPPVSQAVVITEPTAVADPRLQPERRERWLTTIHDPLASCCCFPPARASYNGNSLFPTSAA